MNVMSIYNNIPFWLFFAGRAGYQTKNYAQAMKNKPVRKGIVLVPYEIKIEKSNFLELLFLFLTLCE